VVSLLSGIDHFTYLKTQDYDDGPMTPNETYQTNVVPAHSRRDSSRADIEAVCSFNNVLSIISHAFNSLGSNSPPAKIRLNTLHHVSG
jgi:hypothetical protein